MSVQTALNRLIIHSYVSFASLQSCKANQSVMLENFLLSKVKH